MVGLLAGLHLLNVIVYEVAQWLQHAQTGGGGGGRERETRREREREVDGGSDRRMVGEREMRIKVTCNINVLLQIVKEFT